MIRSGLLFATLGLATVLAACSDSGQGGKFDAAPDLALPPELKHLGVAKPTCCLETTPAAWRVMYLASPTPGIVDPRTMEVVTTGELHLADAYGGDITLAQNVPRGGFIFSPLQDRIVYVAPQPASSPTAGDMTYALMSAVLPAKTLAPNVLNPTTVIARGMAGTPLNEQAFFSPDGRYLVTGVTEPNIQLSPDLTVVEVETARVVFTLPNGSFDYFENVTSSDLMIFENSAASSTAGTASLEGLYVLPLAAVGGTPALIDTRTTGYQLTADEQKVVYTRFDSTLWLYDLSSHAHLQIGSGVVSFTLGGTANGPLVWIGSDLGIHISNILQPVSRSTPPGSVNTETSFLFTPDAEDLYYFANASSQDGAGNLYRLSLRPGDTSAAQLIAQRVSTGDLSFVGGGVRFIRNLAGSSDSGDLIASDIDGHNQQLLARGVPKGSVLSANPAPIETPPPKGNPVRGPIDMQQPVIAPVYAFLVNAVRDTRIQGQLFDDSTPIVGQLAFARGNAQPVQVDPSVHEGSYSFSDDGYILAYIGGAMLDINSAAYLGSLHIYQTLVEENPVVQMLDGVSEISNIRERAFFVSAPSANPPGVYFVHY